MLLKYNIANIKHERRLLDIKAHSVTFKGASNETAIVHFETNCPHKLSVGDYVFFSGILSDEEVDISDKFRILYYNFSPTTFSIEIERFKSVYITGVNYGENISVMEVAYGMPIPVVRGESFSLYNRYWECNNITIEDESLIEYTISNSKPTEYIGYEYVKNEDTEEFYQWQIVYRKITDCVHISDYYFEVPNNNIPVNEEYFIKDERFITKDELFRDNMNAYEYLEMINISLPMSQSFSSDLLYEESIHAMFKEKRDSLIPAIVDYEKRCFSPYYKHTVTSMAPIDTITFNLHFRDRSDNSNWVSNDLLGWNQYKVKGTTFVKNETLTNGDLLGYLNFTDEDVYYRKKKISKSFLRLSFYDSMDPMKQMLIYYSTIFLDSGDLYGKYIKNIEKKVKETEKNPLYSLVNDSTLGDNNLTVSFKVTNKYNKNCSSEGFYLYLFPDGIDNDNERTIYMKAEFNHAGYGVTVPLIFPNNGSGTYTFESSNFPTSLIDPDDGDLSEYYRQLYIPVKIRYDKTVNDYIYYFPISRRYNENNLLFNLYEPKINPID